jgi:hypothetical protein
MSELFGDGPVEIDPDIAIIQARQRGPSISPGSGELPSTAFVASLNGLGGPITLQPGTVSAGLTVTFTQGTGTVSFNLSGLGALATVKCNTAAIAPGVNDDQTQGYARFSQWIDTALDDIYSCTNPATGAAVWRKLN